jgi:hypothetical protein
MERFYMGLRNVWPKNLPIPNLQTFKPYALHTPYTIDIKVCQAPKGS